MLVNILLSHAESLGRNYLNSSVAERSQRTITYLRHTTSELTKTTRATQSNFDP